MLTEFTDKIKRLKPSPGFVVEDTKERDRVLREARELRKYGVIDFNVTTREMDNGKFKVVAL